MQMYNGVNISTLVCVTVCVCLSADVLKNYIITEQVRAGN